MAAQLFNQQALNRQPSDQQAKTLDSWKEIAAFLRRGIRTVQRWERTEGLPVRRHLHLKRGSVYAISSELTNWQLARRMGFHVHTANQATVEFAAEFERLGKLIVRQSSLAKEMRDLLAMRNRLEYYYPTLGIYQASVLPTLSTTSAQAPLSVQHHLPSTPLAPDSHSVLGTGMSAIDSPAISAK